MSIGADDLHKAIKTVWDAQSLDDQFTAYWTSDEQSRFIVLNENEAAPNQPWPYCTYEQEVGITTARMSGHSITEKHEIRDIGWFFRVHARKRTTSTKDGKQIAAEIAEEIIKVFGGHPTVSPQNLTLDNGSFLIAQYQNDFSLREGDEEWLWTIQYMFRLDVPVKT